MHMGTRAAVRGVRYIAAAIVGVAAAVTMAFVFIASGNARRSNAAERSAAPPPCEKALLRDWSDGRIDRDYPLACYRAALKSLPADLKVYSSAPDDIARALSQRILQSAGKRQPTRALMR
jgi:hypothetical protein